MLFWRLVLLGMPFLALAFGQVLESDNQQRYSRSVANMGDVLHMEDDLVSNVEKLAEALSRKAKTIKWGVFKMMKRRQKYRQSSELFANPIDSFSLIRHMQSDWLMWLLYLEMPVGQEELAYLDSRMPLLPQYSDFVDAAEGIRKMQITYQMLASDIANGLLDGVQYNSYLEPIDCLAMGLHLMNDSRWYAAEQWIRAGIEGYDRKRSQMEMELLRGPKLAELYRKLGQVQMKQRNHEGALQAYQVALKVSPHDSEIFKEYRILEGRHLTLAGIQPIDQDDEEDEDDEHLRYPPCCSGRCEVPRNLTRLYCVYNHAISPFLQLAPIKTEILSIEPLVMLLHDMISQRESTLIRTSSKEHLFPSATTDADAPDPKKSVRTYRTSKSVWYSSDFNDTTKKITQRLGDATGLDMHFTEFFQVINYGLGGLFETHFDMLLSDKNRFNGTSDRIATTLFYLNGVRQGGGTHFPRLNLTVFPQPGSALFWYNLDTKGNDHWSILHTGCPVIVGSKWVMSKWVRDMGQEFTRPCVDPSSSAKEMSSAERLII